MPRRPLTDEAVLVRRALSGVPSARDELHGRLECAHDLLADRNRRHGEPFPPAEVEGMAETARRAAWEGLEHASGDRLEAHVLRLTTREWLRRLRARAPEPLLFQELGEGLPAGQDDPDNAVLLETERVYAALAELPRSDGALVRLVLLEERSFAEIARHLDKTERTARTWFFRGLRRLASLLDDAGPTRTHPAAHGHRLDLALAAGEDPRAAFRASPLVTCAACTAQMERVLATSERVARVGEHERRELALLAHPESGRADRATQGGTRSPLFTLTASLLGTLALLGVLARVGRDAEAAREQRPVYEHVGGLLHSGARTDVSLFEWRLDLPPRGHFIVRVVDSAGLERARSERLYEARWRPADPGRLPSEFTWTVEVYDEPMAQRPLLTVRARVERGGHDGG